MDINQTIFPYMLHQPRSGQENAKLRTVRLGNHEDEIFEGYRRIQIISQTMALLHTRYPALQLMQDFRNLAELLLDVPAERWHYLPRIRELQAATSQHLLRNNRVPVFSTIAQVEESRQRKAEDTIRIREDIDRLMNLMLEDEDSRDIVDYIKQSKFRC